MIGVLRISNIDTRNEMSRVEVASRIIRAALAAATVPLARSTGPSSSVTAHDAHQYPSRSSTFSVTFGIPPRGRSPGAIHIRPGPSS